MTDGARNDKERGDSPRVRVLVIDDEPMFGRSLALAMAGEMEVVSVVGGRAGLARLDEDDRFDAILCDLMMPGTTGMDVHAKLADKPDLQKRLIFVTGGPYTEVARSFIARISNQHLQKPFDLSELRRVVSLVAGR